ncbi:MAG: damage-inducible protein DinB [Treponema sp.]|nr:damage-inducible protein DinB [Treponema sp.]
MIQATPSGLFRHIIESTNYTLRLCRALKNRVVQKALVSLDGISLPNDGLYEAQWKSLKSALETIDNGFVNFIGALEDGDLKAPVKIDWYDGNPADVPLCFMLHNLSVHGTHHRGQISQILDELKIDNNYSGLNVQFLVD